VVQKLHADGKVDKTWWDTYRQMQIDSKESTYEQLMARHAPVIAPAPPAKAKAPKVKLVKKAS
ncbi:MAG TPA: hypothetical protein VIL28_04005, partial [Steroidobacteraceae bacterium]